MVEGSLSRTVGRQWELRCAVARRDRVTPSVCFSISARRREFWPDGDLGSSNRPFPRRRPQSIRYTNHVLCLKRRDSTRSLPGNHCRARGFVRA